MLSEVLFYTPGQVLRVKTDYIVAEQLVSVLPMYAQSNPGAFLTIRCGDLVRHVLPLGTAFSVSHAEVDVEAVDASRSLEVTEKLTKTMNESLTLYFDEAGQLLSF